MHFPYKTTFHPIQLYFDIDETLLEATIEDFPSHVRTEAKSDFCNPLNDPQGFIQYPTVAKQDGEPIRLINVKAYSRKDYIALFKRINIINSTYGRKLIDVNFITNAIYEEKKIFSILTRLFGEIDFSSSIFINRNREIKPKGKCIYDIYCRTLNAIPKDRIFLIDDSEVNCKNAEEYGFKAIRIPTSSASNPNLPYSKSEIFKQLNQVIESVVQTNTDWTLVFLNACNHVSLLIQSNFLFYPGLDSE